MTTGITSSQPLDEASKQRARQLSQLIKQRALAEGFEKIGIVPAETLDGARERLLEWLASGFHGAMTWMTRDPEMRADPRKLFPNARSVIVVAKNYYTGSKHTD